MCKGYVSPCCKEAVSLTASEHLVCGGCGMQFPRIQSDVLQRYLYDFRLEKPPVPEEEQKRSQALRNLSQETQSLLSQILAPGSSSFLNAGEIGELSLLQRTFFWMKTGGLELLRWIRGLRQHEEDLPASFTRYQYHVEPVRHFWTSSQKNYLLHNNRLVQTSKKAFTASIVDLVVQWASRIRADSILDFGCGIGRYLPWLISRFPQKIFWGFDYVTTRVFACATNCELLGGKVPHLFLGEGTSLPLPDKSVDLLYCVHVLEQVPSRVERCLREMARITRKRILLIEPRYEGANVVQKMRMRRMGYMRNLLEILQGLGWPIEDHPRFEFSDNPLNPSGLTVINTEGIS